jgi:hypothetical protein
MRVSALIAAVVVTLAPSATTGPTTSVGGTTATVTGSVDPGGASTSWYVEYGTSTSYGARTAAANAGSGTSATSVSSNLSGLAPGTTYHYRIVATSSAGTSRGGDAVFTTLVPPVVSTESASSVTASSATLNGSVDPNGRATTYYFDYGTSTGYGARTATRSAGSSTSAQHASIGVSGLEAGRTYHFRLVATSDAGTSTGKDFTFATKTAPAVSTAGVSSVTPASATLDGTVTPNGLSTTWWFEYGTSTSYGSRTSSHGAGSGASPRSVSQAIKGLKAATTYHYRLVAQNSSGRTVGADQSFTTVGPPLVQTAAAQSVTADTAVVGGTLDTRGRPTTWWFDYGTSTSYGKSTGAISATATTVATTLTGLAPATLYHYRLVAKSDAGTTTGPDVTFTTLGVTLAAPARAVVFGGRILLSGVVPTHAAGEQVVLFVQPYGSGSFHSVTTLLTGANGVWSYLARPPIMSAYAASWRGGMSAAVAVSVHPQLTLARLRSGKFVVRALGGRSFAHRVVQVQRRVHGRWSTVKRIRLGAGSRAAFTLWLPRGRSSLRATFSVNQAGLGFLGATSRVVRATHS